DVYVNVNHAPRTATPSRPDHLPASTKPARQDDAGRAPRASRRRLARAAGAPARRRRVAQLPAAFALDAVDLGERRVDVLLLLQEPRAAVGQELEELGELAALVARHLVHVEELADLGEREAQALAPQDQLQPDPLALAVDAHAPRALRRQQALVLVEADRARGQREFLREGRDRVGGMACGRHRGCAREGKSARRAGASATIPYASATSARNPGPRDRPHR